jgi:hypothetical protein
VARGKRFRGEFTAVLRKPRNDRFHPLVTDRIGQPEAARRRGLSSQIAMCLYCQIDDKRLKIPGSVDSANIRGRKLVKLSLTMHG